MTDNFDAIFVGSGINSLVGAAVLANAGSLCYVYNYEISRVPFRDEGSLGSRFCQTNLLISLLTKQLGFQAFPNSVTF